ncbi:MAG: ABC transporter ATP-binding protein/permease [Chloroflexota bacterium]|nr:ABC transporter ATP-binding protein/permease [Chloroflexota bacterium]
MSAQPAGAGYFGLLGTYLRPQRGRVSGLALLLGGSIALQLINPQVIRYFIDSTQAGGPPSALLTAAALFLIVGLAQRAVALATTYSSLTVGWTATNALRADLALHCLNLDMAFHKTHTPGELIERIDGDVTALANFFAQFVIRLLGNAVLILGILVLLFAAEWRAGLGVLGYICATLIALAAVHNLGVRRFTASRQAEAEQFGFLEERLGGLEDIQGSGAEAHTLYQWYARMRAVARHGVRAHMAQSLTFVLTNALYLMGYGLSLALGAYLYSQGRVSIGTAFLIVYYISMVAAPLENIREQADDLQKARAGLDRVRALFRLRPSVVAPAASGPAQTAAGRNAALNVSFDRVAFTYNDSQAAAPDGQPVLRDITFRLPAGQVLGVLGRTGSGKTTLTRLLFRLYDPTDGAIRLDDTDIRLLPFADLRTRVGMVTQDVQLFQATLRDNLAFFNPTVGDAAIQVALAELGLDGWVQGLPQGLDTPLAAGGAGLSAGEAQLLAFTRVFLKDPGLIILDEAASRLDPVTEARLEHAVDHLLTGRTGIIIAHRLRTVERADRILILDGGRVVEYGPRAQLAADPTSRFYHLLQTGLEDALV